MTAPDFRPRHVVPPGGMATWADQDATDPLPPLEPLLPVQIVERHGDRARARCADGWSAWVDGRRLLPVPPAPPATGSADPRPLLAAAEDQLGRYRRLVAEVLAGRLDRAAFAERARGTRIGVVVDGDAVWLYDARHGRWCCCDGASLAAFAASADVPSADAPEVAAGPVEATGDAGIAPGSAGGAQLPDETEFPPPFPPLGGPPGQR
ncbi:hypothetical protein ACFU7T_35840 [Streptomyces sp. NPDC057555]|uniref:hypothetical protein n=1 Tax=Streptomyces sp. NPDC057555 TaxID=3346166 RepID=UPI0036802406